mmetsp:Transcript_108120/g.282211  ORF Transcript_108120/g.282211 Transcript_108120/m.282211 type:complete len:282 (-) Transcript_108120:110-955(-)
MFTPANVPEESSASEVTGSLSICTFASCTPSAPNSAMYEGPRTPLAHTTSVGTGGSGDVAGKRTCFTIIGLLAGCPASNLKFFFCAPVATSQIRHSPERSQDASNRLSRLKSASSISAAFIPPPRPVDGIMIFSQACFSDGAAGGFCMLHTLSTPSVPPVTESSPEGDHLATFCDTSLPSVSLVHSSTCVSVFALSLNSRTLQLPFVLASHRPFVGEKVRLCTTCFSVFRAAIVFSLPVASSYLWTCTLLGTSFAAAAPPPPEVRMIWLPLLARPRTGKGV